MLYFNDIVDCFLESILLRYNSNGKNQSKNKKNRQIVFDVKSIKKLEYYLRKINFFLMKNY